MPVRRWRPSDTRTFSYKHPASHCGNQSKYKEKQIVNTGNAVILSKGQTVADQFSFYTDADLLKNFVKSTLIFDLL